MFNSLFIHILLFGLLLCIFLSLHRSHINGVMSKHSSVARFYALQCLGEFRYVCLHTQFCSNKFLLWLFQKLVLPMQSQSFQELLNKAFIDWHIVVSEFKVRLKFKCTLIFEFDVAWIFVTDSIFSQYKQNLTNTLRLFYSMMTDLQCQCVFHSNASHAGIWLEWKRTNI